MKLIQKKITKMLLPPIIPLLYLKIFKKNSASLFDGDDKLFKKILGDTRVYGEYGCGQSTEWVLKNTNVSIKAVDTSKEWVKRVLNNISKNDDHRIKIDYIDLGEIGNWGRPVGYSHKESISLYTDMIWTQGEKPDTVLIDGRFRVCCLLTSLKYADEGTRLVFDDYTDRRHYHVVEKFVEREEVCGRQCLFIVPNKVNINIKELDKEIERFRYVME